MSNPQQYSSSCWNEKASISVLLFSISSRAGTIKSVKKSAKHGTMVPRFMK